VIRESADHEVLFDRPDEDNAKVRVSGPFTVEAIPVAVLDEGDDQAPLSADARSDDIARSGRGGRVDDPGGDYVGMMLDLLKKTGVQFKAGRHLGLPTLRPVKGPYEHLHAESETDAVGDPRRVAVSLGSKHAPVTPRQVLQGIQETRGYDIVLFVGFACDPEARRMIDAGVQGRELQFVHAAPDILVNDLLKTTKTTKLFTVFGAPDVKLHREKDGQVSVELAAVDLYDPTTGETRSSPGEDVAAWFVDHDYDGKTFCICQALFPGRKATNPWEKLQKALKGTIDEDKFEALRSTRSLPFTPGTKICVRVIDDRGNEVMKIVDPPAKSGKA
jgi:adenine-specific DNA-methyltransferase